MNEKSSDDIYLSKGKVERYRKSLLKYKNGQTAVKFLDALALQNASYIRIRDYGYTSMQALNRKDDTMMETWTKEEIKQIVSQIVQQVLIQLKLNQSFYHILLYGVLNDLFAIY